MEDDRFRYEREYVMQQNIITLILASVLGFFLSGYWMFTEVKFVVNMNEFDQDISWLLQVPLMLFIVILIFLAVIIFIDAITRFNFQALRAEVPWKKLIGTILVFDAIIVIFFIIHIYFDLEKNLISQFLVVVTLVAVYIYGSVKQGINPIFFLVSLLTVSVLLPYMFFEVFS
jgi:hypothetical protein